MSTGGSVTGLLIVVLVDADSLVDASSIAMTVQAIKTVTPVMMVASIRLVMLISYLGKGHGSTFS
jgi:hypothetical protein